VLAWPIESQAACADAICIMHANDAAFCEQQLRTIRQNFPHSPPINTTGVGNLAYLAVHGHEGSREEFKTAHLAYTALLMRRHQMPAATHQSNDAVPRAV
jgi:hypothetical protein